MTSFSSPSPSSSDSAVVAQLLSPPLSYLRAYPALGVLLCTEHRCCYTLQNYSEHLRRAHKVDRALKVRIKAWIEEQNVSGEAGKPPHYSAPLPGLEILSGWCCNVGDCMYLTQSDQNALRHGSHQHGLKSKQEQRRQCSYTKVQLQTLFAKSRDYFIVDPTSDLPPTPSGTHSSVLQTPEISRHTAIDNDLSPETPRTVLSERFRSSQEAARSKYRRIEAPQHISELSPWQRLSKYHEHLATVDIELLASSCSIPRRVEEEACLYHVSVSVQRVLRSALSSISELHHVDARRLNTFQPGTLSQDPLDGLQESQSISYYADRFVGFLCYFWRVVDGHFDQSPFQATPSQVDTRQLLQDHVESYIDFLTPEASQPRGSHRRDATGEDVEHRRQEDMRDHGVAVEKWEREIDRHTTHLCAALVQHPTSSGNLWSPMLSYCAAAAWDPKEGAWRLEDQCGSHLSQMIYCSQLVILAHAHDLVGVNRYPDVSSALEELCAQWIVNDSKSPVSDMNRLRLYAMRVSRNTVRPAQIRWQRDGETLNYADITYPMRFLAQEIDFALREATLIFERDLCLGLPEIPTYDLADLRDNWDSRRPGCSFLDDPRNAVTLDGGEEWLWHHIESQPHLRRLVLRKEHGDQMEHVRSEFAKQYEISVQRFLEYMLVLVHKGSGQPARRKEFLGMRWQNMGLTKRDIFVHDGYLLFLLTYHKSLSRIHVSRHPVRVMLPAAGLRLVQFLVLIQPLRRHFHHEVHIPSEVSEYLWSDGSIWPEDKMSRIVKSIGMQATGERVSIQSWRQIAVGIAIKKFSGLVYEADMDLPGDEDDDLGGRTILDSFGGAMADVFHHQAAHSVQTGNRAYGGTINFNAGLTDAGLQEYFRASRMWHGLCHPESTVLPPVAGHRRAASSSLSSYPPLLKRVALQQQPRRHRRHWGEELVMATLQRLYPQPGRAHFKTAKQAELVNKVVTGHAEIIGVLGTGEGKSLSFMLPSCLPHAATTVVVVPLVILKTDLIRRCRDAHIAFSVWSRHSDLQEYVGSSLLFVAVEEAVSRRFRTFLGQLDASEGLDRVVFDESHLVLTASRYRPKMALVRELREFRCQVVFLTATLPPLMQPQFERRLLLSQPCTVRSRTFRGDIFYHIQRSSRPGDFLEYMIQGIQTTLAYLEPEVGARVIVYTQSRREADQLGHGLGSPLYYSDSGNDAEKEEAFQRWRQGESKASKVMVATGAFGMGVDYGHVRAVIHMGAPRDLNNFAQEVGRLGRDGQGGTSRIILPYGWQPESPRSPLKQDVLALPEVAMRVYLGQCRCLAAVISRFQDGREAMQYCVGTQKQQWCSICQQHGQFSSTHENDFTPYWDRSDPSQGDKASPSVSNINDSDKESDQGTEWLNAASHGQSRLRLHRRDEERGRDRYVQRLRVFHGRCMICALLHGDYGVAEWHELDACRRKEKWQFFRAKREAVERGKMGKGWLEEYVACYGCGNPQEICGSQGAGVCEFRDMVLPAAWALFWMRNRWGLRLEEISGAGTETCSDEERWMDWVGEECDLYGLRACQGARMADWVMEKMAGAEER